MKQLLAHYHIKQFSHEHTEWLILCLLHELRIMTAKQLHSFLCVEYAISMKNVYYNLSQLKKHQLIDQIKSNQDNKTHCYYLTKEGHHYMGGCYSFPKVPEYNLNHHLMVTDSLAETLHILHTNPHLRVIQSERRQVYEMKDCNKEVKGKIFTVSDYLFRFQTQNGRDVNWYFEIELTAKTKRRYMQTIFPKYIHSLKKNPDARLFYVTPSLYILQELERFKNYFLRKYGEEYEQAFQRLHILPQSKFTHELKTISENDSFIHW